MKKYFILGPKASVFHDASSGLLVTSADPKKPTVFEGSMTKRIEIALQHNHIKEVAEPSESEPAAAGADLTVDQMDDKQLLAYYKANFDVTADDAKSFKAMSREEKIKFLTEE